MCGKVENISLNDDDDDNKQNEKRKKKAYTKQNFIHLSTILNRNPSHSDNMM